MRKGLGTMVLMVMVVLGLLVGPVAAAEYPTKPINLIVVTPPGGVSTSSVVPSHPSLRSCWDSLLSFSIKWARAVWWERSQESRLLLTGTTFCWTRAVRGA